MLANPPILHRLRRVWVPYSILGGMLLLTFIAARSVALLSQAKERAQFDQAVVKSGEQLQRHINRYLVLLDGLRGLANAKVVMTSEQFRGYVDALQLRRNYPGVQGL